MGRTPSSRTPRIRRRSASPRGAASSSASAAGRAGKAAKIAKSAKSAKNSKSSRKPVVKSALFGRRLPKTSRARGNDTEHAHLRARIAKLESLLDVAKGMTAERDLDALLKLIVNEAVNVVGADRCTLWIVDRDANELWTKVAQGLGVNQIIRIPLGVGIAGKVAVTNKTINIPDAYSDPRFNRDVDRDTGYRTRNIIAVPMHYTTGEVTGVLQALNKKNGAAFTTEDEELLIALGANAAVAIENAILYEEIDRLFEGFVKASVVAIESRDPTTSGHSERVARLTLGIAENLEKSGRGSYAGMSFGVEQMREIRYAALLHDFGKVGVRENVLTKANKLYAHELELIETRFRALTAQMENTHLRSAVEALRQGSALPADIEEARERELARMSDFLGFIRRCNQPTVLESGGFERLREVAGLCYVDHSGAPAPLISTLELERLSIPRGSLDQQERIEIESHVSHTFRFLSQIPWTRALKHVPEIAFAHHEKLDGQGYPRQLPAEQIPVQSRMMAIADIYDALTASDRPYKKAVPHEKAVDILQAETKAGKLDRLLLDVFLEAEVFKRVTLG